jgi:2-polyprenyl-6-methoxyphenol hydroxylase-like FAD-dependent oxidoreductase
MGTESRHAEVIGAGIAGLTAATALARCGWSVRIHERDDEIRAVGSGIYLWTNGLAVLDEFSVLDFALDGAHYGGAFETRDRNGRVIGRHPVNVPGGVRVVTILRERLIDSLLSATVSAGVGVVTKSSATRVDPDGVVEFGDGSRAEADLVVIANGVNSRLRDQLGLLRRRRRLGQSCARVLIPREPDLVPTEWENDYVEVYSGKRFVLYTPSSADLLYLALVCPSADGAAIADPLPSTTWIDSFPHLEKLLTSAGKTSISRWDDFERVELHSWSEGKVAVLGDAAHAQPPYLGQGGGCAMAAATGLAQALRAPGELPAQLLAWERRERPLIEHTQRFAYWLGRMNDVPDFARAPLLRTLGRSAAFGRSRLRTATSIPHGVGSGGSSSDHSLSD